MRIGMMAMIVAAVGLNLSVVGCAQNASEKRADRLRWLSGSSRTRSPGRVSGIGAEACLDQRRRWRNQAGPCGRPDEKWTRWPSAIG